MELARHQHPQIKIHIRTLENLAKSLFALFHIEPSESWLRYKNETRFKSPPILQIQTQFLELIVFGRSHNFRFFRIPFCSFGSEIETSIHYFLNIPVYHNKTFVLMNKIKQIRHIREHRF